jgi:ADP-heptose:LPS heptosyltransferase
LRGDVESLIIGSPQRFGLNLSGKKRPILTNTYSVKDSEFHSRHLTKTWEQMIREFGFWGNVSFEPFILKTPEEKKKDQLKIGIAIGSSNNLAKQWPVNSWIHLIQLLCEHETNLQVVLYGTKSDFGLSSQILSGACLNEIENLVGQTSIVQLAEEFSACSLVFGCDSGAVHLASAVGTPTITIFGPTNHTVTSPCFNNIKKELVSPLPLHSMSDWSPTEVYMQFKKLVKLIRND